MKKVIAIVGPTAIGKTKISIEVAKHYNLDIISADSVAVYKKLDIGSAKPTREEMCGVKHYLLDLLEPAEQYSVDTFQKSTRSIIEHNNPIIIAGGTGLYVQSVLFDYEFSSKKRDTNFEENYKSLSNTELYNMLVERDKQAASKIHPNNRKRVLRALEVFYDTNKSISSFDGKKNKVYDSYIIYLNVDSRDVLYDRINKRVDLMIQNGLVEEVKNLYNEGIMPNAIGYKELIPYFKGEISLDLAIDEIKKNSRHLAKRQMTWFKNQMDTHFYSVDLDNVNNTLSQIYKDLDEFLWE